MSTVQATWLRIVYCGHRYSAPIWIRFSPVKLWTRSSLSLRKRALSWTCIVSIEIGLKGDGLNWEFLLFLFIFHSSRFFLHQLKLVHIIFLSSSRRLPLGNFLCLLFCFPFTRLHCFYVDKTFLSCKSYLGSQSVPLFFFSEKTTMLSSRENGEMIMENISKNKFMEKNMLRFIELKFSTDKGLFPC